MNTYYNGVSTPNPSKKGWGWVLLPLLAVAIFFVSQIVCSSVVAAGFVLTGNIDFPTIMAVGLLTSSIATTVAIMCIPPFGLKDAFSRLGSNIVYAILAFVGILLGTFAANIITELMSLENTLEEEFLGMSQSVLGIISIGIIGPICEEVVFRGGIMRPLLNHGVHPWIAIIGSAIVFGIIHWNPVQIPFALTVGITYGVVYYCTGSLVITTICHIFNNLSSMITMNQMGEDSMSMTLQSEVGTTWTYALLAVAIIGCVLLLRMVWIRLAPKRSAEQVSQTPGAPTAF